MGNPDLSILIATQGRREDKFAMLLIKLMLQVNRYKGQIEVVAYWNNGEHPIGKIRQDLVENARGDYVCFIDDDDDVPDYYCHEIMKHLGKDYVGFKVKFFNEGMEGRPAYHSLRYQVWLDDDDGFYRGVTHLNPIRREIATRGTFSLKGASEDTDWATSVLPFVKDQNYVDKVMYYYYHDKEDSSFGGKHVNRRILYGRPEFSYKYFRYHPSSKLISKEVSHA